MTYRELLKILSEVSEETLDETVTVHLMDEYFPVKDLIFADTDVLDPGHAILETWV